MNVVVNNLSINYVTINTEDKNKTILFLHGFGGGIFSFAGLQSKLKNTYNTVNLDLPSFGLSSEAPSTFTIYDYADVVVAFLQELNINKVTIVCHSFGARIGIILASLHKDLVEKLIIIDGAGVKPRFSLKTFLKIKYYKFLKRLVKWNWLKEDILKKFGSSDYKSLNESQKQVFKRVIQEDLTYLLKYIEAPTLLIWGKKDKDTPLYMAKKMKKHIRDCGLVAFFQAGHYSYLDKPYETEQIIRTFIGE